MSQAQLSTQSAFVASVTLPGDEGAVMQHTIFQLDAHLWVRGHQLTIVTPMQGGDPVHQGSGAVKGQPITSEDHLTLGRQQRQGMQFQRTIWATYWEKMHTWPLILQSELFLLLSHYSTSAKCFHRSYYVSAVLQQIGCRQQQFIHAAHKIICQNSSVMLLEICACLGLGADLFEPFLSTNI